VQITSNNSSSWGIKGSLGRSLQHFPQLGNVDLPWAVLLGWSAETDLRLAECLPEGLLVLVLAHDLAFFSGYEWDDRVCVDRLYDYLAGGSRPIGLESLGIRFDEDSDEVDEVAMGKDAWKKVQERCQEVDCRFQIEDKAL